MNLSLFLRIGFRNVLRNRRRTFLTSLALGIGVASMIIVEAFTAGMITNMVKNVTGTFLGSARIESEAYSHEPLVEHILPNYVPLITNIKLDSRIRGFALRTETPGMISSAGEVRNIQLFGINPLQEQKVSRLHRAVIEGRMPEVSSEIMLGKALADYLDIRIGERVVVTVAQASTGEMAQEMFRVQGFFSLGSKNMDGFMAFITRAQANKMLGLDATAAHSITLQYHDPTLALTKPGDLWLKLKKTNNIVGKHWGEMAPSIQSALEYSQVSLLVVAGIVMFLVFITVMNTMFMALYERLFEFGVLRALGTHSSQLVSMIVFEGLALGLLSYALGLIVTGIFGFYMVWVGIDYGGLEFGQITLYEPIYAEFTLWQFVKNGIILFVFCALSTLYPALHASRLNLSQTLKRSL